MLCWATFPAASFANYTDQITLYTPAFEGPGVLGRAVATILNLQLFQTLRVPRPIPGATPTLGVVVWGQQPLDRYEHTYAELRAEQGNLLAQAVFWGKVYEYGDGAVATTNLSIPQYADFRQSHPEIWRIHIPHLAGGAVIEADIPQRRYSFRPIALSADIIARYSSRSIPMFEARSGGSVIAEIDDEFRALASSIDSVEVLSGGRRGWVRLPELSTHGGEAIEFVGGVVRVLRGDWLGVAQMMRRITKNEHAPNELRTDAFLYLGLAEEMLGRPGTAAIDRAISLSPYARRCVVYAVMSRLAEAARAERRGDTKDQVAMALVQARQLLIENRALFSESDAWFQTTWGILAKLPLAEHNSLPER